ncbi:MAG TPA: SDR family oxidoreductase [Puia sp.]|jgi:UDP-glucose 4-epimerase|nr:SDR family oxidoreductase [Puia sp.]
MSDILILGSEGFIGANLTAFYLKKGWKVSGIDHFDNPTQPYHYYKQLGISDFTALLLKNKFKFIVNAAGSGNVGFSITHPLGDFESNCFETAKILDSIHITEAKSIYLHISSAAVYGNPQQMPVKEVDRIQPLSPYGWHKFMSELLCKEYFEIYGIRSCIIRPFSVFGVGLKKQLFWDIYHKSIGNSKVELFGSGQESRDFLYIDDLIKAIDILLDKAAMESECYNVASGIETTIQEAAQLFLKYFPSKVSIFFNGQTKPGDPLKWRADISKIKELGFSPHIQIEEGLELTYRWISKLQ